MASVFQKYFSLLVKIPPLLILFLSAHDPKLTVSRFLISGEKIIFTLTTPLESLRQAFPDQTWEPGTGGEPFQARLNRHLFVTNVGKPCALVLLKAGYLEKIKSFRYDFEILSPEPFKKIIVCYDLYLDIPDVFENQNLARFQIGRFQAIHIFTPYQRHAEINVNEVLNKF